MQLFGDGASPVTIPPGRGEAHLSLALSELIRVRQDGTTPLPGLLERTLPGAPPGSTIVLVSSTATPRLDELRVMLEQLAARRLQAAFVLVNHLSFLPLDKWPVDGDVARTRIGEVLAVLDRAAVPHAVMHAHETVDERMTRGLFR